MNIIGEVSGKDCIIIDDMIDTAGSAVAAAKALKNAGAKKIFMAVTHPVLSDPAYERLSTAQVFEKFYVTDSIPLDPRFVNNPAVPMHVVSLSNIISNAIVAISQGTSVSEIYDEYAD